MTAKQLAALGAFIAAAVFLGLLVFRVPVGDVNELAAGLFCWAVGFVIERLP